MRRDILLQRSFLRSALGALVAALVSSPALAWADPQCKSPFENVGCFVITSLAAAFFAAPLGVVACLLILVISVKRKVKRDLAMTLGALGALPVAFIGIFLGIVVFPEGLAAMLVGAVVVAAYAALALRFLSPKPGAQA